MTMTISSKTTIGPRMLKDHQSVDFALDTWDYVKTCLQSLSVTEDRFERALEEAEQYEIYKRIPPGYNSLDELARKDLGISIAQAKKNKREQMAAAAVNTTEETIPTGQGQRRDIGTVPMSQKKQAEENGVSERTQRYLDYLAKPENNVTDLHEAVKRGEIGVRTAYERSRGIPQKISIPLEPTQAARAIARHFDKEQIMALIHALAIALEQ